MNVNNILLTIVIILTVTDLYIVQFLLPKKK